MFGNVFYILVLLAYFALAAMNLYRPNATSERLAGLPAGEQTIAVEIPALPAGVYLLKARFGAEGRVGRLVVMYR